MFPHNEGLDSVVPPLALTSLAPHCSAGVAVHSTLWPPPRSMCTSGSSGPDLALESAAARVCREAGERIMTNMLVRDMDLALGANHMADGRRLEVVVDGLSLFHGAQLAIDTTLVSAARADGTPRPRAARKGGAVLDDARARKEVTYPEFVGEGSRDCRSRGGSRRTLVCRGGTVHPRTCNIKSYFGA